MKKIILILCLMLSILTGCNKNKEPHWSYRACIDEISTYGWNEYTFDYTVKEIDHKEHNNQYDEVHCFDITITSGQRSRRYCCFTAIKNGKVVLVDCDVWGE